MLYSTLHRGRLPVFDRLNTAPQVAHRPYQGAPNLADFDYDGVTELRRTALMVELAPELLILTVWDWLII